MAVESGAAYTIGTPAECTDGPCGKVIRVVVDPVAMALTHLVVEPAHKTGLGRLVPIDLVQTDGDPLRLNCTLKEFEALELAEETRFRRDGTDYGGYAPDQVWFQPYYGLGMGMGMATLGAYGQSPSVDMTATAYDAVPQGEVAVHRGDAVHATDGAIGHVQGLVIDPRGHGVTHILLQEGHLWGRKEVAIPIKAVAAVDEGIRLNITKREVGALPAVPIAATGS